MPDHSKSVEARSARFALREATRAEHDATELAFGQLRLERRRNYIEFLRAHVDALAMIEPALGAGGWQGWQPRSPLLRRDLDELGVSGSTSSIDREHFAGDGAIWGAQYVLEGSRLGGQLLARQVARGLPTNYLDEPAALDIWRAFVAALDETAPGAGKDGGRWLQDAVEGAKRAFEIFRQCAETSERVAA